MDRRLNVEEEATSASTETRGDLKDSKMRVSGRRAARVMARGSHARHDARPGTEAASVEGPISRELTAIPPCVGDLPYARVG